MGVTFDSNRWRHLPQTFEPTVYATPRLAPAPLDGADENTPVMEGENPLLFGELLVEAGHVSEDLPPRCRACGHFGHRKSEPRCTAPDCYCTRLR